MLLFYRKSVDLSTTKTFRRDISTKNLVTSEENLALLRKHASLNSQGSTEPNTASTLGERKNELKRNLSSKNVQIVQINSKKRSISPKFDELYSNYGPSSRLRNMHSMLSDSQKNAGLPPKPKLTKFHSTENKFNPATNYQNRYCSSRMTPKYSLNNNDAWDKLKAKRVEKSTGRVENQLSKSVVSAAPFS